MRPILLLIGILAAGVAAGRNTVPDPRGSTENRLRALFAFAQSRQHYRSLSASDSLDQAASAKVGELWSHERPGYGYGLFYKFNDGAVRGVAMLRGDGTIAYGEADPVWKAWEDTLVYVRTETDGTIGNEVVGGAADSSLTRSGGGTAGSPYTLGLNLSNPNTWLAGGHQRFNGGAAIGNATALYFPDSVTNGSWRIRRLNDSLRVERDEEVEPGAANWVPKLSILPSSIGIWGSSYAFVLKAGTLTSNITWTLPTTNGSSGQFLQTNGSGVLSWATALTSETDGVVGNEVVGASSDSSLTRSGSGTAGSPYKLGYNYTKHYTSQAFGVTIEAVELDDTWPSAVNGFAAVVHNSTDGKVYIAVKANSVWYLSPAFSAAP